MCRSVVQADKRKPLIHFLSMSARIGLRFVRGPATDKANHRKSATSVFHAVGRMDRAVMSLLYYRSPRAAS